MRKLDVKSSVNAFGASSLGLFFVVVVALGGLGGHLMDVHFHQSFIFALLGIALGMIAGIREMLKTLKDVSTGTGGAGGRKLASSWEAAASRSPYPPVHSSDPSEADEEPDAASDED